MPFTTRQAIGSKISSLICNIHYNQIVPGFQQQANVKRTLLWVAVKSVLHAKPQPRTTPFKHTFCYLSGRT